MSLKTAFQCRNSFLSSSYSTCLSSVWHAGRWICHLCAATRVEYLLRNPQKRGQDLHTTRRSCAKFKHIPTTVVNYVEGTRFTDQKTRQE